ncbi:hypothetical protein [Halobellus sp. H-GB7]|uniref:hypothetical protein n=1 Tax=Halobellus sp. H-GB7 TaxID=3069756 RepID=UPI0027B6B875|nr:hypothetical protein [Halobellus sp. H-GB7]MDQ2053265.1 hypothetical protein [Halobellus sp. H-GB7]
MNPERPLRGDDHGDIGLEATKYCGCLSCTDPAVAVIEHPKHGLRTVCGAHINGHDVDEWLVARDTDINADDQEVSADV